jgi:hypothetical protein
MRQNALLVIQVSPGRLIFTHKSTRRIRSFIEDYDVIR